ncbi:MAG: hypothetical protein L0H93_07570 [Nocardioides sp.]|nr:hypothetical protein [Nocardioides sp.]
MLTLNLDIPQPPERTAPSLPDEVVADLRSLIGDTTVSRFAAEETLAHKGVDGLFRLFAARVGDNLDAWCVSGDWPDRPQSAGELVAELVEAGEFDPTNPADARLLRKALDVAERD